MAKVCFDCGAETVTTVSVRIQKATKLHYCDLGCLANWLVGRGFVDVTPQEEEEEKEQETNCELSNCDIDDLDEVTTIV